MYAHNKAWRKRNPAIWQAGKQRYYKQFEASAHNGHQRYTIWEDDMILNKVYPDRVIAKKILRSVKAIQIRRLKLKKEVQIE